MSIIGQDPAPKAGSGQLWIRWSDGAITLNAVDNLGYVLAGQPLKKSETGDTSYWKTQYIKLRNELLKLSGHECSEPRHSCDL